MWTSGRKKTKARLHDNSYALVSIFTDNNLAYWAPDLEEEINSN